MKNDHPGTFVVAELSNSGPYGDDIRPCAPASENIIKSTHPSDLYTGKPLVCPRARKIGERLSAPYGILQLPTLKRGR